MSDGLSQRQIFSCEMNQKRYYVVTARKMAELEARMLKRIRKKREDFRAYWFIYRGNLLV